MPKYWSNLGPVPFPRRRGLWEGRWWNMMHGVCEKKALNPRVYFEKARYYILRHKKHTYICRTSCRDREPTYVTQRQIWQKHLRKSCCLPPSADGAASRLAELRQDFAICKLCNTSWVQQRGGRALFPRKNGPFFEPPSIHRPSPSPPFRSFVLTAARPFVSLRRRPLDQDRP